MGAWGWDVGPGGKGAKVEPLCGGGGPLLGGWFGFGGDGELRRGQGPEVGRWGEVGGGEAGGVAGWAGGGGRG